MESVAVCSQCLRALRQAARRHVAIRNPDSHMTAARLRHRFRTTSDAIQTRGLSSQASRLQQQAQKQSEPSETPFPTTSPTVTTNVVPPAIQGSESKSAATNTVPDDGASSAQMQARIKSSLQQKTPMDKLARKLRAASPTLETYVTYGAAEALFKSCAAQAPYTIPEESRAKILTGEGPPKTASGEDVGQPDPPNVKSVWFDDIRLLPTFSTWSQVTFLHMYMLMVRLRALDKPEDVRTYQQYLLENFSQESEDKMLLLHNMSARGIRNRYLKDLFIQWRGILAAYDEGLVKGDTVLASAIWRNLFKGDENVDWERVGKVLCYMRKCIRELDGIPVKVLPKALAGEDGIWLRGWKGVGRLVAEPSKSMSG